MAKKKSVSIPMPEPSPVIDSNAAAKGNGKAIALKPEMIAIFDTLLRTRDQSIAAANEAAARLNAYAQQCASLAGVDPKDWDLNWDLKAFVRKPKDDGKDDRPN